LTELKRKVGEVDFNCPNCNRQLHRVIWERGPDIELDGKGRKVGPIWNTGFETAFAICSCKAQIIIGIQPDGEAMMYWINESKMKEETGK